MDTRIISIGTLAANTLWGEKIPVRTGHSTCTLVRAGRTVLLVDPGLPEQAIAARLSERAGIRPEDVTHVFLTSFQPDTARGLGAFDTAQWLVSKTERERVGVPLALKLRRAMEGGDAELKGMLAALVNRLQRCAEAPEKLAPGIDLFPLHGVTPGCTGLLLASDDRTTLIAGDAVATIEHLEKQQVLPDSSDVNEARESLAEAIEMADVIIPGRDNWTLNTGPTPF